MSDLDSFSAFSSNPCLGFRNWITSIPVSAIRFRPWIVKTLVYYGSGHCPILRRCFRTRFAAINSTKLHLNSDSWVEPWYVEQKIALESWKTLESFLGGLRWTDNRKGVLLLEPQKKGKVDISPPFSSLPLFSHHWIEVLPLFLPSYFLPVSLAQV